MELQHKRHRKLREVTVMCMI